MTGVGTPVVATEAGDALLGLTEDEKTGYLVPPEDTSALADCLITISAQPVRAAPLAETPAIGHVSDARPLGRWKRRAGSTKIRTRTNGA